jgi:hypothetical protein
MKYVIDQLNDLLHSYGSDNYRCWEDESLLFQCGFIMFGALMKQMHSKELYVTGPEWPFEKLCFDDLCNMALSIESPRWTGLGNGHHHRCGLAGELEGIVVMTNEEVEGLYLSAMKGKTS